MMAAVMDLWLFVLTWEYALVDPGQMNSMMSPFQVKSMGVSVTMEDWMVGFVSNRARCIARW